MPLQCQHHTSKHLPASLDQEWLRGLARLLPPDVILQIDAGTDVIRDDGDSFTKLWRAITFRHIYLRVLLAQFRDPRVWAFDDISIAAIWSGAAAVAGEGLAAGIENDLAGDRDAHNSCHDSGGTIFQRRAAAVDAVHVIKDVSARANLGQLGNEVRLHRSRRRSAGNDSSLKARPFPEIQRLGQQLADGAKLGLIRRGRPVRELAREEENSVEAQAGACDAYCASSNASFGDCTPVRWCPTSRSTRMPIVLP